MERLGDARRWERIETDSGVGRPRDRPAHLPAPGTPYRCTRCWGEHARARCSENQRNNRAKCARVSEMRIRRSIERRQGPLLDGIRMSIEMGQIGYRRLQSAARRRQAVERVGEPSLDAWALVDTLNRLRLLISHMISALAVFIRPATAIASSTWTWPTGGVDRRALRRPSGGFGRPATTTR